MFGSVPAIQDVTPDDLTFGIKFGVILSREVEKGKLGADHAGIKDLHTFVVQQLEAQEIECELLNEADRAARGAHPDYSKWCVVFGHGTARGIASAGSSANEHIAHYYPKRSRDPTSDQEENSIFGTNEGLIQLMGVRIMSPVFILGNHEDWMTQINKVLTILREKFRPWVNQSCDLHIHVGNLDSGFTLKQAGRIAATLVMAEPSLDALHPNHRGGTGVSAFNNVMSNKWAFDHRFKTSPQLFRELLMAPSFEQIVGTANFRTPMRIEALPTEPRPTKFYKYNFTSLPESEYGRLGTIEFRQHMGTIDMERIYHWIVAVTTLTIFAANCRKPGWIREREEFSVWDLQHDGDAEQGRYFTCEMLMRNIGLEITGTSEYFRQHENRFRDIPITSFNQAQTAMNLTTVEPRPANLGFRRRWMNILEDFFY